jgi:hypothetical protein
MGPMDNLMARVLQCCTHSDSIITVISIPVAINFSQIVLFKLPFLSVQCNAVYHMIKLVK